MVCILDKINRKVWAFKRSIAFIGFSKLLDALTKGTEMTNIRGYILFIELLKSFHLQRKCTHIFRNNMGCSEGWH
jgi:hypothetical protein